MSERADESSELAAVRAELAFAIESYKAFAYSVSHDLRAPLRAIAGFASILKEAPAGELSEDTQHFLDIIHDNVQLLSAQMEGLLELSRLEHRGLIPGLVDMTVLAERAVERVRTVGPERDVAVTVAPLPPAFADTATMEIALFELVANAWKFTRQKPAASIVIDSPSGGREDEVTYRVRDDGVGFAKDSANRLFVAFRRLHGPKEFEGLGIGLAKVRSIVIRHHGRVWAEAEPDRGATFAFSLPAPTAR
jgi:light-regulated signal transduction histidine kinase (bacteriophytochrome)